MAQGFDEAKDILSEVGAWGYLNKGLAVRKKMLRGRRVLDVGMGGGPWCVVAIDAGAEFYIDVDPLVGTDHVRDWRHASGPADLMYHSFPYTPEKIMENYPNIKLFKGYLDQFLDEVISYKPQFAILSAVSEHLADPHSVIKTTYDALDRNGIIWLSHSNYYSWVGHHGEPRDARNLDLNNPAHRELMDWRHLDPNKKIWTNKNLNRMRLADFRDLIDKYFEIVDWSPSYDAIDRLTPEIRDSHKQYSVEELLSTTVYVTGRKRDYPLHTDLSDRQFFHPPADYGKSDVRNDHELRIAPYVNHVFFSSSGTIESHSDNNLAGCRVMELLTPGQKIELRKETGSLFLTVAEVARPNQAIPRIKCVEPIPQDALTIDREKWRIVLSDDIVAKILNR